MALKPINDSINNLGLSEGLYMSLQVYGSIHNISDLITYSANDLLGVPNIGAGRIREIKMALEKFGLKLSEKNRGTPRITWDNQ